MRLSFCDSPLPAMHSLDNLQDGRLAHSSSSQGAGESGQAEAYMCQKIMRSPLARNSVAKYLGTFVAEASDAGFTRGTQWLIWKYESDTTLAEAAQVQARELLLVLQRAHTAAYTAAHVLNCASTLTATAHASAAVCWLLHAELSRGIGLCRAPSASFQAAWQS